jgi:Na+/proline symporter
VIALLGVIVALSAGDLYMTLVHLTGPGMIEENPLARVVMNYNSPAILGAWKFATVTLGVGILFWARRTRYAEFASLFCCAVLTWLTFRWVSYSEQVATLTRDLPALVSASEHRWVEIDE